MKYIRTEKKIYKVVDKNSNGNYVALIFDYNKDGNLFQRHILFEEYEIIAEADTIEELCDEFVIICSNHNEVYSTKIETLENIKFWYSEKAIVYGAIWTDKGLIYVAKMNSDGELVLI